jgi:D-hexose-6-phosphate mutarotase
VRAIATPGTERAASATADLIQHHVPGDESSLAYLELARGGATAKVYLFGGVATSFAVDGVEYLAARADCRWDGSKGIAAGVPHCFPQFGPGKLAQHGFARDSIWRLVGRPTTARAAAARPTCG